MKVMDIDGQDECHIEAVTSVKKKKMKQAQLPFQMQSPVQSPNTIQSKKRKLTSPSVECMSSKPVKILKKSLKKDVNNESSDNIKEAKDNSNDCIELVDIETENVKENETSNKVEATIKLETLNQTPKGHRKLEKLSKLKPSPLTKFFQKTDMPEESSKQDSQNLLEKETDKPVERSSDSKPDIEMSLSTSNTSYIVEDSPPRANNSLYQSDSDVATVSSDNEQEDKDEQTKAGSEDGNKDEQTEAREECKTPDYSQTSKTSKTDKSKQRKLTPKQQEKKLLSAKKREERQKLKMEKERKLEEERENRRKEKEEKRKEKEEREKAEREQKIMEKKMKEQKRQMEMEQKQKEKQAKEEERRKKEEAREEEKKKREEEKLEAERRKQKAASNFTSFFVAKKQEKSVEGENGTEVRNFMPFEVKADMKVAPVCRRILSEQDKLSLDETCNEGNRPKSDLYLSEIKDKKIIPRKSSRTWPLEAKDEVIILDEENDGSCNIVNQDVSIEKRRPKLLQFCENQRPPYWGTWRKRSGNIHPRKPFSKDSVSLKFLLHTFLTPCLTTLDASSINGSNVPVLVYEQLCILIVSTEWFNYEVDSDDEWEEEEPGESLHGSDDEKDEENPDDNEYDVDNEFMVPHGYLSDEEVRADEEDQETMTPETQKFKLKALGEQFECERNTKTLKLKPKIIGCIWRGPENQFSPNVPQKTVDFLTAHEIWVRQIPVILPTNIDVTKSEGDAVVDSEACTPTKQQTPNSKKRRVPESALPDLIRLVHGNIRGRKFLVKEFMSHWSNKEDGQLYKGSLLRKIREIATWEHCPEEGPMYKKKCWYVAEEIRKRYLEEDLTLPNHWTYNLTSKRKDDFVEVAEKVEKEDKDKEKKSVPLITQFTKKITQEEMKKQLTVNPESQSKGTSSKPPKRATLISVRRGEQFSKSSKKKLLLNFGRSEKAESKDSSTKDQSEDDDVVVEECSVNALADDQKEIKSDDKKKEDRLGTSVEFEEKEIDEKKSSRNDNEGDTTLNRDASMANDESATRGRESIDSPMEIDDKD
ncbi:Chromatin assembly factor 1 subunit A-A, partial [Anthophora quadrimaculata]